MSDLKRVYGAVTEEEALSELIVFKEKWEKKYPSCVKSWEGNWDILSTFYAYPMEIRRIIYTTYTDKKTMPIFPVSPVPVWTPGKISA